MARIKAQPPAFAEIGIKALAWISSALRPLKIIELKHALATEVGDTDLERNGMTDEALILSVSAGLIRVDSESNHIRLVHFTVEEYLKNTRDIWFPEVENMMVETCLTYLSFQGFRSKNTAGDVSCRRVYHFCKYALAYWGIHARRDAMHSSANLVIEYLNEIDNLNIAGSVIRSSNGSMVSEFTGLHLTAHFGLIYIAEELMRKGASRNAVDSDGNTPIFYAVWAGNMEFFTYILSKGDVDINQQNNSGYTLLICAIIGGHESITKSLLCLRSVKADAQDKLGNTALCHAIGRGRMSIVSCLLDQHDVDLNHQNDNGETPLMHALQRRHQNIARLLLNRPEIKVDIRDHRGMTVLSYAARLGMLSIVKDLLNRNGVDPNNQDEQGMTPLLRALEQGHEKTARVILDRQDVKTDVYDRNGKTALSYAAGRGFISITSRLLDEFNTEPNHQDRHGCLLQRNDIERNDNETSEIEPLMSSIRRGHEEIARLLLDRREIKTDIQDLNGETLFSSAVKQGLESIVSLLFDEYDVSINHQNHRGQTPLMHTAYSREIALQRPERRRPRAIRKYRDRSNITATSDTAIEPGDIITPTLSRAEARNSRQDARYDIPLTETIVRCHENIARLLLHQEDIKVNLQDSYGRTALSHAAGKGCQSIVHHLLEKDDIDIDQPCKDGLSPLCYAKWKGHEAVIRMLQEKGAKLTGFPVVMKRVFIGGKEVPID